MARRSLVSREMNVARSPSTSFHKASTASRLRNSSSVNTRFGESPPNHFLVDMTMSGLVDATIAKSSWVSFGGTLCLASTSLKRAII